MIIKQQRKRKKKVVDEKLKENGIKKLNNITV